MLPSIALFVDHVAKARDFEAPPTIARSPPVPLLEDFALFIPIGSMQRRLRSFSDSRGGHMAIGPSAATVCI